MRTAVDGEDSWLMGPHWRTIYGVEDVSKKVCQEYARGDLLLSPCGDSLFHFCLKIRKQNYKREKLTTLRRRL